MLRVGAAGGNYRGGGMMMPSTGITKDSSGKIKYNVLPLDILYSRMIICELA